MKIYQNRIICLKKHGIIVIILNNYLGRERGVCSMTLDEYIKLNYVPGEVKPEVNGRSWGLLGSVGVICSPFGLEKLFNVNSEDFSKLLAAWMKEKDVKASDVYVGCNMSKATFSRLRSTGHPSKNSVLALCIGLKLSVEESIEFLARAGFAFNPSDKRDVIVRYFICTGQYDIDEINTALYEYDEDILGERNLAK